MSYILKALKKLEQEKAARRVRPPDIQSAILAPERTPDGRLRIFLVSAVILLLLCGSFLAYVLLQQSSPSFAVRNSAPTATLPDSRSVQPQTVGPGPALLPREAERKIATEGSSSSNNPTPPAVPVNRAEVSSSPPMPRTLPPSAPRPNGQEPAVSSPSGLKVNGIALQDDPDESVAIVNGVLAHRGATIQGMSVEEIFGDRVRFSGNGETFEVKLSK